MSSPSTATSSERSCCICESPARSVPYQTRGEHRLLRCGSCRLVYLSRGKAPEDFIVAARKDRRSVARDRVEFWSFPEYHAKHERVFHQFFEERLKRLRSVSDLRNGLLDIGSGYGLWLKYLAERGIQAAGIEPSAEACRYSREVLKLELAQSLLEDFSAPNRFSALTLCDVLEHFERPDLALDRCAGLLEPNGLIYVQVPNVLGFKLPPGHGLGLPNHLWQFSHSTLSQLLRKSGFEPIRSWTGVQGVIGVYEKGGPTLMTRLQWNLARTLKLGNRLQILARRRADA